ncbi:nitroreductase [Polynucleobacter sp. AP-Feld-500C-C5]|uniref:nitroreductase n=1 Tax=Polynucleobacter sp. AP-Feld-500C-C5 TaxID=2576924 RepID=UPI001C0C1B59|nr:nitroreductase [Polynucleobacter sp. AP-Feld-500C-C5]MBU3632522.1 nitroreductase [Polynucleobacter sp. AP-Feld-500C-C5]
MNSVADAIQSRMSVRAFTKEPVSKEQILKILNLSARAPSGTNTQPWKAYVLEGAKLEGLCKQVCATYDSIAANPELEKEYQPGYDYYPSKWFSPYIDRRRENGWSLYGLLGITKGDKDKMHAQHRKNFQFFGAPVGIFFTIDKELGRGSMLDYGMFLQNFMVAAKGEGLDTCPQAAWNAYTKIILPFIGAQDHEMLVCGMALGYADKQEIVNTFRTPRVAAEEFTTWLA